MGALVETAPWTRCGYLALNQADRAPEKVKQIRNWFDCFLLITHNFTLLT